jgi:hypothetical protein
LALAVVVVVVTATVVVLLISIANQGHGFNIVSKRLVAWIRSSLLLKIQKKDHHYLYEHKCYSVQDF